MQVTTEIRKGTGMTTHNRAIQLVNHSDIEKGLYSLHFDLPGEKVNKFSKIFMTELNSVLDELQAKSDIRCLVVLSEKPGIFIAGADIELIQTVRTTEDGTRLAKEGQDVIAKLEKLAFPVVAAVNGACLGGGLEFALCCKYIVVSDGPATRLGLPEVNLGVLPGMGGTVRLPRRIGLQASLDYILSGKTATGEKAVKAGLADVLLPHQDFEKNALALGARILRGEKLQRKVPTNLMSTLLEGNPLGRMVMFSQARKMVMSKTRGHYPAPLKILDVMSASAGASTQDGLEREQRAFGELAATDVSKRLIELFFAMEHVKKLTGVEGYRLKEEDKIKNVGLLGAGVMGGGIAQLVANKKMPIRMKDIDYKGLALGMANARKLFDAQVKRRRMTTKEAEMRFNLISPTTDYSGLSKTDVVIEAVVENMDVKKKVLQDCEAVLSEHALFATNTSSLSVTEMATAAKRPENVVGMHFFNPVHKMPLIEVIRGEKTSDQAVAAIFELSKRLGKTPIVVKDGAGFLVNRLLMPYLNEASYLMAEGAPLEILDKAVLDFGMPMGPATLLDEIGIDVGAKVAKILQHAFGDRMKPCHLNEKIVAAKLFGKKSGKGFYIYDGKGKSQGLNPDIYKIMGVNPVSPRKEKKSDWIPRMMYPMINEAALCLEEKIVATPEDVDLAMIMGTGFPPFRGGVLRYADSLGAAKIVKELERLAQMVSPRFAPAQTLVDRAKRGQKFYS